MKTKKLLFALFISAAFFSCTTQKQNLNSSTSITPDYLTIDQAIALLKNHESVAPLNPFPGVS